MRKINTAVTIIIMILFLVHAIAGIFQLTDISPGGAAWLSIVSWALVVAIAAHIVMATVLTVQTLKGAKKAGKFYAKENRLFLTRRVSGFAVLIFIVCHVVIFMGKSGGGVFRLHNFGAAELTLAILLVITLALHVITNINPLFISFGIRGGKLYVRDVFYILAIILLLAAIAFLIYYLRWNVYWR